MMRNMIAAVLLFLSTPVIAADPLEGAKWIACDRDLEGARPVPADYIGSWISGPTEVVLKGYRAEFELPDKPIVRALAWWGPDTEVNSALVVNDADRFFDKMVRRPLRSIDLAFELKSGLNNLEIRFLEPNSSPACFGMRVLFADGSEQFVRSGLNWKGVDENGKSQEVVHHGNYGEAGVKSVRAFHKKRLAPAWFRTVVEVRPGLKKATLRHCGLGYGDSYVNGSPVSDRVLSPPQTDYEALAMFETDEVTRLLKEGSNALSVHLASGWFHQVGGFGAVMSYGRPRLRAVLELEYADGTLDRVVSDDSWSWKEGAIVEANIYSGEIVDYRRDHREWASPTAGEDWKSAVVIDSPTKELIPVDFQPMRKVRELAPKSIVQVGSKSWLVDFGENITGWVKFPFQEESGAEILTRYSEMAEGGEIWNVPLSHWWCHGEPQRDVVIADGEARVHESTFTYKGFRWVQISGLSKAPDAESLRAIVVHNDCEVVAEFESSDPMLNRLWEMGVRGHHGNMHSILEDCPHREKCQWGGDLHGSWSLGFHALDSAEFYRQQVRLFYTGQMAEGGIPGLVGVGKRLTNVQMDFNWGVSPLFLSWRLWTQFGDLETAREFHPQMRHYLAYFEKRDPNGIPSLHRHADHASPSEDVPRPEQDKALISAINYFAAAERFADLSDALGKSEDEEWARALAAKIRKAVFSRFDETKMTFGNGTHDSLALGMGLFRIEPERQQAVADSLVDYYRKNGYKFDGGFMSYWIYPMLSRHGYVDDALKMMVNTDYPGPAWSVEKYDATTFWEMFASDPATQFERSLNHHAVNHPAAWLLTDLAGLRIDYEKAGEPSILLAPCFPKNLEQVSATMRVKGKGIAESRWKQGADTLTWSLKLPKAASARVILSDWQLLDGSQLPETLGAGSHEFILRRKR